MSWTPKVRKKDLPLVVDIARFLILRFTGALYKASEWIHVGPTEGRRRYDRHANGTSPRRISGSGLSGRTRSKLSSGDIMHLCHCVTESKYSFVQLVMAASRPPSTAILGRAEYGVASGPALASLANRPNTSQNGVGSRIWETGARRRRRPTWYWKNLHSI